jgi:hypothetical protein
MAIITISREVAALGDETAGELVKLLGYRFVDRFTLEERMKSYGVDPRVLEKYDERKPGFLASFSQDRDDYLHFLKMAKFQEALGSTERGRIFIGRGAYAVFAGIPGVVPVFLVANMDVRIERVRSYFHCDEKKARSIIERIDQDRAGFHTYFFESDWKDPGNYRVSLNTGHLCPSACARIIEQVCIQTAPLDVNEALARRITCAFLAQKVAHHVLYEKNVQVHFLDVTVTEDGEATLFGVTNVKSVIDNAAAAAQEVEGVHRVVPAIQIVDEISIVH